MWKNNSSDTSWQKVSKWYNKIVGDEGHYFHKTIVVPGILRLLNLSKNDSLIDFACGQGILAKNISAEIDYQGIDLSTELIRFAKENDRNLKHKYLVADVSKEIFVGDKKFTKATIVLALQNIRNPDGVIKNAAKYLTEGGELVIVLNHPCFRIPRHSFWDIDREKKVQSRKMDSYMSAMEIPILANPGKGERSEKTWSFHMPISAYSEILFNNGFVIKKIEEWVSDKKSTGPMAKMEDRSRKEFPMFMTIVCKKS
ncbi:MAG: methyltransferase domain-containing protein [Candidatus Moranbacteria bacterium]|nr:methyltransferase domain-containing protein [Candidatus Moranbacteria bacterium]